MPARAVNRRIDRLRRGIADIVSTRIAAQRQRRLAIILIIILILALIGGWPS